MSVDRFPTHTGFVKSAPRFPTLQILLGLSDLDFWSVDTFPTLQVFY